MSDYYNRFDRPQRSSYAGGPGRFSRPSRPVCPVAPFEQKDMGYVHEVETWLSNPHAYFKSYGEVARGFQMRHRSERLRIMTFVAAPADLVGLTPQRLYLGREVKKVEGWDGVFSAVVGELGMDFPETFDALQRQGLLAWLGCPAGGVSVSALLMSGALKPAFDSWEQVIYRIQWLLLMCGIKLNDAVVQVDPYTDAQWKAREQEIHRKRREERTYMAGRRAAQEAWADAHPNEAADFAARADEHGRYVPPSYREKGFSDFSGGVRPPRRPADPTW